MQDCASWKNENSFLHVYPLIFRFKNNTKKVFHICEKETTACRFAPMLRLRSVKELSKFLEIKFHQKNWVTREIIGIRVVDHSYRINVHSESSNEDIQSKFQSESDILQCQKSIFTLINWKIHSNIESEFTLTLSETCTLAIFTIVRIKILPLFTQKNLERIFSRNCEMRDAWSVSTLAPTAPNDSRYSHERTLECCHLSEAVFSYS